MGSGSNPSNSPKNNKNKTSSSQAADPSIRHCRYGKCTPFLHGAAGEANVDQARRGWEEGVFLLPANLLSLLARTLRTVVHVRAVSWVDRRLAPREQEVGSCRHAVCANATADLRARIVGPVSVEIAAMSVLAWHWRHRELDVHVGTLACLIPLIDLKRHIVRQGHVQDVHLLPSPAILDDAPLAIVLDVHIAILAAESRWERHGHGRAIVRHHAVALVHRLNEERLTIQEGP